MIENSEINIEQTFIILKPDCIERGLIGKIINRFEDKFLRIIRMEMRWKNSDWCKKHYGHLENEVYKDQEEFMLCAPTIGIVLMGPDAVSVVRWMVGCTDSNEATPGTIRGQYGTNPVRYNLVHASDSIEAAEDEIEWYFDIRTDDFE
jgi:nucleoside-diphosphate kinase